MIAEHNVITSWIAQWDTHFVEPTVFGTTDPDQIACLIDTFCQKELGTAIADYLFYASSIGAVCGVCLGDGRRVVVKVHQPSRSLDFLKAVVRVQHYLVDHGYPCPKPLLDPQPLAHGIATTEEFVDEGVYHQAYDPAIRRSMAEMLAWLLQLTRTPEAIPGLQPAPLDTRLPGGVIWPTPHTKLFDFEATTSGAEWIDEIARQAQEIKLRGAGHVVLGHIDWGVKHFRYVGERVRVIYDWDSLVLEKEPIIVGHASGYFTYTEFFGEYRRPTAEEACAFVAEYEVARGRPFTREEHQTLNAAKIYGLAYGARCEHALHPNETTYPEGSCRSFLAQYRSICPIAE
jgi:Phosphotransferase enzyme family